MDKEHGFDTGAPDEAMLDVLWAFCKTSVAQTRGGHPCPFCNNPAGIRAHRNGESLLLGTSEIRVFFSDGRVYAAPTLVYHYVVDHHYRPPAEFVTALLDGPRPGSQEYFALLRGQNLEWNDTSVGGEGYWDPTSYNPETDDQIPLIELMARSKSMPTKR